MRNPLVSLLAVFCAPLAVAPASARNASDRIPGTRIPGTQIPGDRSADTRTDDTPTALSGRIVDVLGDPVPAARIDLVVDGRVVARTAADGEGVYLLPRVPAGGGDLRITAPRKAPLELRWRGPTTARVRNAVLEDAARLSGRVLDPRGRAVPNAIVVAVHPDGTRQSRSDEHGAFAVDGVPLRRVVVRAWSPDTRGFAERALRLRGDERCELRLPAAGPATRVVRVAGLPRGLAGAQVQVISPSLALLPHGGRAPLGDDGTAVLVVERMSLVTPNLPGFATRPAGHIVDGGGAPLDFTAERAALSSVALSGRLRTTHGRAIADQRLVVRDRSERDLATAAVDARGGFRVEVDMPPDGLVRVGLPLAGWELVDDARELRDGHTWVDVADLTLPVPLWAQRTGELRGPVADANGTLLALADVVIADPETPHRALLETATDAAGHLRVALPAATYDLLATTPTGDVLSAAVEIAAGRAATAVAWRRIPTGSVTGRVTGRDGEPLPGVRLFFANEVIQNEHEVRAAARQSVRVVTDRHGRFRCRGLPGGEWTVVALDESDLGSTTLTISAGKEVAVDVRQR